MSRYQNRQDKLNLGNQGEPSKQGKNKNPLDTNMNMPRKKDPAKLLRVRRERDENYYYYDPSEDSRRSSNDQGYNSTYQDNKETLDSVVDAANGLLNFLIATGISIGALHFLPNNIVEKNHSSEPPQKVKKVDDELKMATLPPLMANNEELGESINNSRVVENNNVSGSNNRETEKPPVYNEGALEYGPQRPPTTDSLDKLWNEYGEHLNSPKENLDNANSNIQSDMDKAKLPRRIPASQINRQNVKKVIKGYTAVVVPHEPKDAISSSDNEIVNCPYSNAPSNIEERVVAGVGPASEEINYNDVYEDYYERRNKNR